MTLSNQIRYEITAIASGLPISVADAKDHLRITGDDEDDYIELLIKAAWKHTEKILSRPMKQITVKQYFDDFPADEFSLLWGNVTSITSVKYYDVDEVEQTFTDYYLDKVMDRARIRLKSTPDVYDRPNAVTIEYIASWTPTDDVIAAMKLIIGDMYEKRENTVKRLPTAADWLLSLNRLWEV
jgi:uncharacterized phiE125 gp8 family phage protein